LSSLFVANDRFPSRVPADLAAGANRNVPEMGEEFPPAEEEKPKPEVKVEGKPAKADS